MPSSQKKYTTLVSNTLLFAISNFSSKLLSFFIRPYLSYALDSPEAVLNPQSVVQPMLGPLWWHATTTQLLLARTPQGTRLLSVKKSPFLERASLSVVSG